jgi:hypothetical protein
MCDTSCDTPDIRRHRCTGGGDISLPVSKRQGHPHLESDIGRSLRSDYLGFPTYFYPDDSFSGKISVRQWSNTLASRFVSPSRRSRNLTLWREFREGLVVKSSEKPSTFTSSTDIESPNHHQSREIYADAVCRYRSKPPYQRNSKNHLHVNGLFTRSLERED